MNQATVIGASNIDITGRPSGAFALRDSIIGQVKTSLGGVGANVASNLSLLGIEVELITSVGKDIFGEKIIRRLTEMKIDISRSLFSEEGSSGKYMATLDETGDMIAAINDMGINSYLSPEFFEKLNIKDDFLFVDTNLERESVEYLLKKYGKNKKIIMDTVSCEKAKRILGLEKYIYALKPNRAELEALTGGKITKEEDVKNLGKDLLDRGIKKLFITSGTKNIYAMEKENAVAVSPIVRDAKNATGAGDCFCAGIIFGLAKNMSLMETANYAAGAAAICVESMESVNPDLSWERVQRIVKEKRANE